MRRPEWFRRLVCRVTDHVYVWVKIGDTADAEDALYTPVCVRCRHQASFVSDGTLFPAFGFSGFVPLSTSKEGRILISKYGRKA